jgi:hypothetical protein
MNTAPNNRRNLRPLPARLGSMLHGIARSRRRGTFLVLVVGTLAMLSIIMIVYVAVGNADRRTSTSVVRRNRSNEVVDIFADYLGQVLSDDVFANARENKHQYLFQTPVTLPVENLYTREGWDAPRTDWFSNSAETDSTDNEYFRPYGLGDDPWLASTTPTWINYRPEAAVPTDSNKLFAKRVDWLHISNIAPDGRFVNLVNLRNNFEAAPGAGSGPGGTRMSTGLSLVNPTNGNPSRNTVWSESADPATATKPALFDSWQFGAFRPAKGPFPPAFADPQDPIYPPNQWADADGDGWLDSRWFEMNDARVQGQPFAAPNTWRSLVPTDPNYRWVFAARIIDLSSLVNVNVATDLDANPNDPKTLTDDKGAAPFDDTTKWQAGTQVLGRSPAEVDLRRLLTMRDFREVILTKAPTAPGAPVVPLTDNDSLAIGDFDPATSSATNRVYRGGYSAIRQPTATSQAVQNYTLYSSRNKNTDVIPGIVGNVPVLGNDINLGLGAYRAIRGAVNLGRAPGRFSNFAIAPLSIAARPLGQPNFRWETFAKNAGPLDRPVYRDAAEGTYRIDPGFDFGLGFRSDALVELLTYRGNNDPAVTSSLEAAVGGRAVTELNTPPTPTTRPITFSPLRENRAIEVEREFLANANGVTSEAALLKAFTDLRQYLTTMSGARPIVSSLGGSSSIVGGFDPERPSSISTNDLSFQLTEDASASSIFNGLAAALMPGLPAGATRRSQLHLAWGADTDVAAKSLRGLYYGHQGPMTALLTAAHLAANFDSGAKEPTDATRGRPYTLVLDESAQLKADGRLPIEIADASLQSWRQYFPAWWLSNQFNLARPLDNNGNGRGSTDDDQINRIPLATGTNVYDAPVPAVNIYGTGDTHPFLTEVASFTVYRDVYPLDYPKANKAINPLPLSDLETSVNLARPPLITINGNVENPANADLLFRAVAIKVHNPTTAPIQLSSNFPDATGLDVSTGAQFETNSLEKFFYFQIGDGVEAKYFLPVEVTEEIASATYSGRYSVRPVIIQAGETIVFYALNRPSKLVVEDRLNWTSPELGVAPDDPAVLEEWLTTQFGPKSGTLFRRIQMLRAEDVRFGDTSAAPPVAPATFAFGTLFPKYGTDQTVMLKRAMRFESRPLVDDSSGANSVLNDQLCDRLRLGSAINLDMRAAEATPVNGPNSAGLTSVADLYRDPNRLGNPPAAAGNFRYNGTDWYGADSRVTITLATWARRPSSTNGVNVKPGEMPAWCIDAKDSVPTDWYNPVIYPPLFDSNDPTPKKLARGDFDFANATPVYSADNPIKWRRLNAIFPELGQRAGSSSYTIPANKDSAAFDDLRRELASNGLGFRSFAATTTTDTYQARPADFLATLAVGPYEAPLDQSGSAQGNPLKRWTTTAEALAMAMGYTTAPTSPTEWQGGGNNFGPLDFYYFDRSTTAPKKPLYDGGFLRLDDFASVRFDASDKPIPTGTGAPIAGNILTMFRTAPDRFAGLTASTSGLVNINTAPIPVLRVLPLASPAQDEASSSDEPTKPTLWPAVNGEAAELAAQRSDFAAMIESYRDKIAVELRPGARNPNTAQIAYTNPLWFAPFLDRKRLDPTDLPANERIAPSSALIGDITQSTYHGGRYWTSGISGIREEPGFRSLAELAALRAVEFDPTTGAVSKGTDLPLNVDFLGHQPTGATPTNIFGVDNILELTADASGTVDKAQPLQFANTQQDRLKVLAALGGSVTVRSDMYAAWFVIRGYSRSDVTVALDQPMAPSVERRFLMLIDRSNVTRPGQKPRIVAMVELPL